MKNKFEGGGYLMGGQYAPDNSPAQGFLMYVQQYGSPEYKYLYAGSTFDSIEKVALGSYSGFGVGRSMTGPVEYSFFLMKAEGQYTTPQVRQIAADTSSVANSAEIVALEVFDDDRVYAIFRHGGSDSQAIVCLIDLSLGKETYFGFHGELNSIILDLWEVTSSTYSLFGLRDNNFYTYYMDTSNSSNDEAIDVVPSVNMSTSYSLCSMDSSGDNYAWVVCSMPNEDLYALEYTKQTKAPTAQQSHLLESTDGSQPSAISVMYGDTSTLYICLTSFSSPGVYADVIKILVLKNLDFSPYLIQKRISKVTEGPISAFVNSDTILIGVRRVFQGSSSTSNSAELIKLKTDFSTTTFSPPGAVVVDQGWGHAHRNDTGNITNTVLPNTDSLRTNVYLSESTGLTWNTSPAVTTTDEMKLTEDGFQTIQPPTFSFDASYSYGASASSGSKHLSYSIQQCQKVEWTVTEAKVNGVDVAWATTGTPGEFLIEPSLATGAGDCCGIAHPLDLKVALDTPDNREFPVSFPVTFTNDAPSKHRDLPDMTAMYQGGSFEIHNLLNYSMDPEDDVLTHTATANVSSGLVSILVDDINSIMTVRASPDLNEAFSVDVTATDPFGNSYSQSMDVLGVTSCPQANCNSCMGVGARGCTG